MLKHLNKLFKRAEELLLSDNEKHYTALEEVYEDDDFHYKLVFSIHKKRKHTCDECTILKDGECMAELETSFDKKFHCSSYSDKKPCYDCIHYSTYGGDDVNCTKKGTEKYLFEYNRSMECPYWEY